MNEYPKILIMGQPFNKMSGGGITLSNLFKGWPKDRIAVATVGHFIQNASTDICSLYYRLGKEEHMWKFPFNKFQRPFPSGLVSFTNDKNQSQITRKNGFRQLIVDRVFFPVMNWLGFFHFLSRISLSQKFKDWLSEYQPEILYLQVSSRESILFTIQLCDYLNIPSVIHMMDDWPSTIGGSGLFKKYWRAKIDKELRQLMDRNNLYLSISDAMTKEYLSRYGKHFKPFHNPIEIFNYNHDQINISIDKTFRILYIGRIGVANKNSIYSFAVAVSGLKIEGLKIEFDIFSCDNNTPYSKIISNLNNVKISPPIEHDLVPELLASYDLLLLPLDFTEAGIKFARYSIPTKASEYMISGIPILVFAPAETAISRFCNENECGFCLTEQSQERINAAVSFLINNEEIRKKLSHNAIRIAEELFDAKKVRHEFQQLIIETSKIGNSM